MAACSKSLDQARSRSAHSSATVNFTAGVSDLLALDVSAAADAQGVLKLFEGLDRTGKLLGEVDLSANAQVDGWQHLVLPFVGVAQTIGFDITTGVVTYENLTVTAVPEPGTYALLALGLAGVAFTTYRRRA